MFNPHKPLPAMIAAILQYLFLKIGSSVQLLISIGVVLLAYLFLYGIEFAWKFLVAAPVALDNQQRREFEVTLERQKREISSLESKAKAWRTITDDTADFNDSVDITPPYGKLMGSHE